MTSSQLTVGISTLGRFHLFDAARALSEAGQCVKLYAAVPRAKIDADLRPVATTRPWLLALAHLRARAGIRARTTWLEDATIEDFGRWLGRRLDRCQVLHALAGTGLEAGRRLHAEGIPWLCDRASTHIRSQKAILEEEYARWGRSAPYFSGEGMERAEAEYETADAIVVPSEFVKRSFVARGFAERKIAKCPFGVDLRQFRHVQFPETRERLRVVFLGTASLRKGIGYLLEALAPLVSRGHVETWLIGAHHPDATLLLRQHAGEFESLGPFPRSELSAWLSRCDVLVLPSVEEGLAVVMAQAMACGLPVVATPNTGAEDILSDGVEGFIVPVRTPAAIRDRLVWMLDNPHGRRAMADAALRRVTSIGGWAQYAMRLIDVYHSVLAPSAVLHA